MTGAIYEFLFFELKRDHFYHLDYYKIFQKFDIRKYIH